MIVSIFGLPKFELSLFKAGGVGQLCGLPGGGPFCPDWFMRPYRARASLVV